MTRKLACVTTLVLPPLAALACLGMAAQAEPPSVLVNETRSLPRGVYVRQSTEPPRRGDIIAFGQPSVARPYLRAYGAPSQLRLLKRVAATPGDRVCSAGRQVVLPGRTILALTRDRHGLPLPVWSGCRVLGEAELFLLGDTPNSFDSRYFGPVRLADIDGVYEGIIRW